MGAIGVLTVDQNSIFRRPVGVLEDVVGDPVLDGRVADDLPVGFASLDVGTQPATFGILPHETSGLGAHHYPGHVAGHPGAQVRAVQIERAENLDS